MPISFIAAPPVAAPLTFDAIAALADTLCDLSLLTPAGPARKNIAAIRVIARQMDEAIAGALGAPQGNAANAQALLEELTGQALSDAQMRHTAELEQAHPDLRLVIGKLGLFYHQAMTTAGAPAGPSDSFVAASPAPRSEAAPRLAPAAEPVPVPMPRLSPPALQAPAAAAPVRAAGRAASPQAVSQPASPASSTGAVVNAVAPSGMPPAMPPAMPLPERLMRCVADYSALLEAEPEAEAVALMCAETGRLFEAPIFDVLTGTTRDRSAAGPSARAGSVTHNPMVDTLVRTWAANRHLDACALAAKLDAAAPHDAAGKLIVDPVLTVGGRTVSLEVLVNQYQTGTMPPWLEADVTRGSYNLNRQLIAIMVHFNIGAPREVPTQLPAKLWSPAPSFATLAPKCHTDRGLTDDERRTLEQARDTIANLRAHKRALIKIELAYEHAMIGCNSPDYDEAFNAGLALNDIIAELSELLPQVVCPKTCARLRIMRADCYRLADSWDAAERDLREVMSAERPGDDDDYSRRQAQGRLAFLRVLGHPPAPTDPDFRKQTYAATRNPSGGQEPQPEAVAAMVLFYPAPSYASALDYLQAFERSGHIMPKELHAYAAELHAVRAARDAVNREQERRLLLEMQQAEGS